jgi:hypothetical protein
MPVGNHPHLLVVGASHMLPCHAWHGRGLGGVDRQLLSEMNRCRRESHVRAEGF